MRSDEISQNFSDTCAVFVQHHRRNNCNQPLADGAAPSAFTHIYQTRVTEVIYSQLFSLDMFPVSRTLQY